MDSGYVVKPEEQRRLRDWIAAIGDAGKGGVEVVSCRQGWGESRLGQSLIGEPLCLADKVFGWGLGSHADSEIALRCSHPAKLFRSWVGVDHNRHTAAASNPRTKVVFSVWQAGACLWESPPLTVDDAPVHVETPLGSAGGLVLRARGVDSISYAHVDWAEAEFVTADGRTLKVGDLKAHRHSRLMPVSFVYGGMESEPWFRKWGVKHTQAAGKDCNVHLFLCHDLDTGLKCSVELLEYANSPACLWNVRFTNSGATATPILEQVKTLDVNWPCAGGKTVHRARGAFHHLDETFGAEGFRDDFMLVQDNLKTPLVMGGVGGRSSVDWMPYFNFQGEGEGLLFGVGWTGQWRAEIQSGFESVLFQAGQENIHSILEPGETIRQPSILMIHWQGGDALRGNNLLRRFIQVNLLPRVDGQPIQAPACAPTWGGMVATSHLARIDDIIREKLPYDYYWIDAGWYGKAGPNKDEFSPQWGSQAGDWSVNRDTFPKGVGEISAAVHAVGKKFLLWVEPERAVYGTPATMEHPEWFLGERRPGASLLLNLGDPEAWKWCVELIAGLIAEQGIDCYRQDFNISPLPFWQANDSPDRVGVTEIRYVEGLHAFLGELRRRFPRLLIDNCASGGRRLDFEMMRHSIPLWPSDMQCSPDFVTERNQQQVHGLSLWLPQFAFGTQLRPGDTYNFRSTLAAGVVAHLSMYEHSPFGADYPYQWLRDRLGEYHRAKASFSGDFYPLTDQSGSFKDWSAYQFHRPDLGAGTLLAFRKKDSPIERMRFILRGLEEGADYELEDADSGVVSVVSGAELMGKGLAVDIQERRDCRLCFYRKHVQ